MPVTSPIEDINPVEPDSKPRLRDKVIPVLTISLVLVLTGLLFIFRNALEMLGEVGYLGTFLVSLAFNASILLPMPIFPVLFVLGAVFNPVLLAIAAAAGGALGEMSGYIAGYSGRGIVRRNRMHLRAEGWMRRWGMLTIFVFTVVPFTPFDLAGLAAGALRFPVWKFLLVCFIGKILLYSAVAFAGAWGLDAVIGWFD